MQDTQGYHLLRSAGCQRGEWEIRVRAQKQGRAWGSPLPPGFYLETTAALHPDAC